MNPNILMIVINRFNFVNHAGKDSSSIKLDSKLIHNSISYDLFGSLRHLGSSVDSGHYVTDLFYQNCIYICNDRKISKLDDIKQYSNDAYIVFYKANSQ